MRRISSVVTAVAVASMALVVATIAPGVAQRAAAATPCAEGFETGTGGWTPWWSGTATRTTSVARSGSASLALQGTPATVQTTIDGSCVANGPTVLTMHVSVAPSATAPASIRVKLVDQASGTATLLDPVTVGHWTRVVVSRQLSGPTLVGVEVIGTSTVYLDDVTLGSSAPAPAPAPRISLPTTPTVAAFAQSACARRAGDVLACWGSNGNGQLGDGGIDDRTVPVDVASGVATLPGAWYGACVVKTDGHLLCHEGYGWAPFSSISDAVAVEGSRSGGCVISTSSTVSCWGYRPGFSLINDPTPTLVPGLLARQTASAFFARCALRTNGRVACWGSKYSGGLGDPSFGDTAVPRDVPSLANIVQLTVVGSDGFCALDALGTVRCWGEPGEGGFGDGSASSAIRSTPVVVSNLTDAVQISTTCALRATSTVVCWGYQWVDVQTRTLTLVPTPVAGLDDVVELSSSSNWSSCAARRDHVVWCWGDNYYGELGDGTKVTRALPAPVVGLLAAPSRAGGVVTPPTTTTTSSTSTSTSTSPSTTTSTTSTTSTTVPGDPQVCARDDFESGLAGWGPWWSGTAVRSASAAETGTAGLRLDGSPSTATRVAPTTCSGTDSISMRVRSASAGPLYVKVIDATGASKVSGPITVGPAWSTVTVAFNVGRLASIGLESYAGVTDLDDVVFRSSTTTPPSTTTTSTTPTPTTPPTSTTPTTSTTSTTTPTTTAPPTTTTTPPTSGTCATEGFEAGTGRWSDWFSGVAPSTTTDAAASGTHALLLGGTTASGQVALPTTCGAPIVAVTLRVRVSSGSGVLFAQAAPFSSLVNGNQMYEPHPIGTGWTDVTIALNATTPTTLRIQVSHAAGTAVYVDDVAVLTADVAPPEPAACATDSFETGTAPWATWWSSTISWSSAAHSGTGSLRLASPIGTAGTASRVVAASTCTAPVTSVSFWASAVSPAQPSTGVSQRIWVKVVDLATGSSKVVGPLLVNPLYQPGGWSRFEIPVSVGVAGSLIGIQSDANFGSDVLLDDVAFHTA